ncbi:arginase family protein [Actinoplanes sp. URMC 104]|uniref:arginase family protein n=1 Tax=Actinoplanes sp. URMC 104 TaxID=3423409 RepID=UPI003F1D279B
MRRIAVLDAPSNLGLRPPTATSVPGCAKAPGALRDHGLITKLNARDAGCLTPPRYDAGDWRPGDGVAHAAQIAAYSRALADRIGAILDAGEFPVVLGGDCSILLGSGLAMHRLGDAVGGRIGLIFVDGHSDFRHPGNASYVGAAAGEDLALVTGRGQADLAAIEGRRPYFRDVDVVVMGIRAQDEYRLDLQAAGIVTRPVPALRAEGAARSAQWAREQLVDCAGYWVHMDVDVLDPAVMPAVDAPSPGGIAFPELELLLAGLVESPHCLGVEITVFDPDYDTDGSYAAEIVTAVTAGLAAAHTVTPRPDLIAARADLNRPDRVTPAAAAAAHRAAPAEEADARLAEPVVAEERPRLGGFDRSDLTAGFGRPERPAGLNRARLSGSNRSDLATGADDPQAPASGQRPEASDDSNRPGVRAGLGWPDVSGGLGRPEVSGGLRPEASSGRDRLGARAGLGWPDAGGGLRPAGGLNRGELPADRESPEAPSAAEASSSAGDSYDEERERQQRRAAAAADSVALAAAGMSEGPAGSSGEVAVPASTLLGVEEADEVPAVQGGDAGDEQVDGDAARGDEWADEDGGAAEPMDHWGEGTAEPATEGDDEERSARMVPRPLGSAPLLDSEPLPATRPGMLRPRTAAEEPEPFSLPVQRPAFELDSETAADVN